MSWGQHRALLNASVVRHVGEDLVLTERVDPDDDEAEPRMVAVRGVLTRPEELARLGLSHYVAGEGRLTLRAQDAPTWLGRGTTVALDDPEESFVVTFVTDNGEGLKEVVVCRSS